MFAALGRQVSNIHHLTLHSHDRVLSQLGIVTPKGSALYEVFLSSTLCHISCHAWTSNFGSHVTLPPFTILLFLPFPFTLSLSLTPPDTFASKVAAIQDQYADASIGNVTGSNAVNVFLGIGVAWSIAAIYHNSKGNDFRVDPGTLAFSVTLFTIFAFVAVAVLMYRRRPEIGGELGGPRGPKIATTCLFFSLWLMYIVFSSLEAYCHVKGF